MWTRREVEAILFLIMAVILLRVPQILLPILNLHRRETAPPGILIPLPDQTVPLRKVARAPDLLQV
ncbi:hypothetical protein LEP1GSC161_4191 [Leptospira santarosai str. CBC1416]|uniref:Uncharacterized protein n=1 Tax=Leptospira santarosai str. CBC1416 TaxID=1193059 RepID=M6WDP1_9LEPT|nr:hypothetical protein LEP1GSC068_0261 [Leptospira sp. Fiocruz LV3954]EMF92460.1 hypothetical protein LEP1GSC005_3943 [Leptospira santarosai str. ST188]EMI60739.1 hypothetical protein LEP1GSC076_2618 [Leptospira sp. Fiocruz LV4135]EMM87306.1 hypothetical protein LEP1GSC039_1044 [Leptospira santarosai str. 2000027870]EMO13606.1 hypothetical protein LEP1GSC165_1736 [Leptospira santarosai str. CBC523]EMO59898.1 hypothetical protein LEP1GSC161_4191 [Leptospira santarosai str. CBC1416]EMP03872.1 